MNLQGVGTALCYQSLSCLGAMRSLGLQHKLGSSWEMLVSYRPLAMSQPCLRPPIDASREERIAPGPFRPCWCAARTPVCPNSAVLKTTRPARKHQTVEVKHTHKKAPRAAAGSRRTK